MKEAECTYGVLPAVARGFAEPLHSDQAGFVPPCAPSPNLLTNQFRANVKLCSIIGIFVNRLSCQPPRCQPPLKCQPVDKVAREGFASDGVIRHRVLEVEHSPERRAKSARVRGFTASKGTGESPFAGIVADFAGFLSACRSPGALCGRRVAPTSLRSRK